VGFEENLGGWGWIGSPIFNLDSFLNPKNEQRDISMIRMGNALVFLKIYFCFGMPHL
jgi:hypothetical protein